MKSVTLSKGKLEQKRVYKRKLVEVIPMSMRLGSMPPTREHTPEEALQHYYKFIDWETIRFGQHVCNYYNNVPRPWPKLFYEGNVIDALELVRSWCEGNDD